MSIKVASGGRERRSYAQFQEVHELPDLIQVQRSSYNWFIEEGLHEIFKDISPIEDFTGNLVLEFFDFTLGEPKYSVDECKERDATYAVPLKVKVRLINRETGEVKEQEVFMGDFPKMTDNATFIINGAERVIVSQLVRSPGSTLTRSPIQILVKNWSVRRSSLTAGPGWNLRLMSMAVFLCALTAPVNCR